MGFFVCVCASRTEGRRQAGRGQNRRRGQACLTRKSHCPCPSAKVRARRRAFRVLCWKTRRRPTNFITSAIEQNRGPIPRVLWRPWFPKDRWPSFWDRDRSRPLAATRGAGSGPLLCSCEPSTVRLAPSGVCLALPVASQAVGSYPAVSPLPVALRPIGGLFSVALSVALPRPAVSWHSALWCPEVPPGFRPAAIRPPTRSFASPQNPDHSGCRDRKGTCITRTRRPSHRRRGGSAGEIEIPTGHGSDHGRNG